MEKKPYIVCCICKNEGRYIEEFVEYHLELGFDKIIIGDNNDIDGERYDDQLKDYIDYGEVEIVDLRGKVAQQLPFYNNIIKNYKYEWCAFIDCDEFITFAKYSEYTDIKDFLNSRRNVYAYALNWRVYGDNNRVFAGEGDVLDRFKIPMPDDFKFHYNFPENNHIKSLIKLSGDEFIFDRTPHNVNFSGYYSPNGTKIATGPFNPGLDFDVLYIRHFYTKSLEEWVNKKMKNKFADCIPNNALKYYPIDDYFKYNKITDAKIKYLKQHGIEYKKKL